MNDIPLAINGVAQLFRIECRVYQSKANGNEAAESDRLKGFVDWGEYSMIGTGDEVKREDRKAPSLQQANQIGSFVVLGTNCIGSRRDKADDASDGRPNSTARRPKDASDCASDHGAASRPFA